jgi:hypothetical protein
MLATWQTHQQQGPKTWVNTCNNFATSSAENNHGEQPQSMHCCALLRAQVCSQCPHLSGTSRTLPPLSIKQPLSHLCKTYATSTEPQATASHLYVCRSVPVAVSHSRSLPSSQHDSSRSSRGLQATYSTAAPCPPSLCRSVQRPVLGHTCHNMTQRSCKAQGTGRAKTDELA